MQMRKTNREKGYCMLCSCLRVPNEMDDSNYIPRSLKQNMDTFMLISVLRKGLAKLGNIVAETLLLVYVSLGG